MGLSDKIKNAKCAPSMFDEIPAEKMFALKTQARIALAIINARKNLGMNQSEFADYCHVSQPMVSKWESGEYNFTVSAWAELSHRLSLPFDPFAASVKSQGEYKALNSAANQYSATNIIDFAARREAYLGTFAALKEE